MKTLGQFVKTTLVGGALFLVPFVLLVVLLRAALKIALGALRPIAHLFPAHPILGTSATTLVAAAGIVVLCFLAGLVAQTRAGRTLSEPLERLVLRRIPGYTFIRTVTRSFAGLEGGSDVAVALAWVEEAWVLSFVLERHASGLFTVFVPSAPTPAAGSVYFLPEDRVRRLDVPVTDAIACIMRLGLGSRELLESLPPGIAAPRA